MLSLASARRAAALARHLPCHRPGPSAPFRSSSMPQGTGDVTLGAPKPGRDPIERTLSEDSGSERVLGTEPSELLSGRTSIQLTRSTRRGLRPPSNSRRGVIRRVPDRCRDPVDHGRPPFPNTGVDGTIGPSGPGPWDPFSRHVRTDTGLGDGRPWGLHAGSRLDMPRHWQRRPAARESGRR
jgi:hypothetical protein